MASRSEKGAKVAGAIVAAASLGIVVYNALKPLLIGEDPWLIAGVAGAIVLVLASVVYIAVRQRRRSLARAIRRR